MASTMALLPGLRTTIMFSSAFLKAFSYLFLRWIPGHHVPPIVLTLFAIYLTSFYLEVRGWSHRRAAIERYREQSAKANAQAAPAVAINGHTRASTKSNGKAASAAGPATTANGHAAPSVSINGQASSQDQQYELPPPFKDIGTLRTAFHGLPIPNRFFEALFGLVANGLLVLMVFDMVYRGPLFYGSEDLSLVRVGHVDSHTARLIVREPDAAQLPVTLTYRPIDTTIPANWTAHVSALTDFANATDFTQALTLSGLQPGTEYEWKTSTGHTGRIVTPGEDDSRLTFLSTSCLKAHFPYKWSDHPLRIAGLEHVARAAPRLGASFMLFLGDFIYADVPRRLGADATSYRAEYRRVYASPSWQGITDMPWLHVMDDHEIANDWDQGIASPYPAAFDPYAHYQHAANPPAASPDATYYSFARGPASFFMLDTRRHRSPSAALPAAHPNKTMLGAQQLEAAKKWLAAAEPEGVRWKVLVSSVPLTRNWRVNAADTWAGYLSERQALLEAMWDASSGPGRTYGVVVLSGDRHEFAATRFPAPAAVEQEEEKAWGWLKGAAKTQPRWVGPDGAPVAVHEFSCSPLSMFYLPFRTYREHAGEESGVGAGGEDQQIEYISHGNSKFGAIDLWRDEEGTGKLKYTLYVDGEERWETELTAGKA